MKKQAAPKKPQLDGLKMADLEDLAREIHDMEDGPEKDFAKGKLQEFTGMLMEKYDTPVRPLEVEKPLVHILDYIPGILRTGLGEAAIAAKRAMNGEPQELDKAFANAKTAINPFDGEMAPGGQDITTRLGIEEGGPGLAETPVGKAMGLTPGGKLDITKKGFASFGIDMLSPEALSGLKNGLQSLAKSGTKKTAVQLTKDLAAELERAKNPSLLQGMKDFAIDPVGKIGDKLYKNRFKDADKAAIAKGQRPMSNVMLEHGAPGITSTGIQNGIDDIVETEAARKRAALAQMPKDGPTAPLGEVVNDPLHSPAFEEERLTYGNTEGLDAARQKILDSYDHTSKARYGADAPPLLEQPMSVHDLERLAGASQKRAAAARAYNRPSLHGVPSLADLSMGEPAKAAFGDLQAEIGMSARDVQNRLMDTAAPGLGGEVFSANKNLSSVLSGAPFLDRPFSRGGNVSSRQGQWLRNVPLGGAWRASTEAAMAAKDVAQTAAAKAMMSPWTRIGVAPAARSAWAQDFRQRDAENPWNLLAPYLPKEK